jgi:pimeloyl-ACP methyl ester carboxylesterase
MAMLEPQRMDGLIALNIPHIRRPPADPVELMRQRFGDDFYIVNFQDSDEADRLFESDPRHFLNMMMRKKQLTRQQFERLPRKHQVLSLLNTARRTTGSGEQLLNEKELDYFEEAYRISGFTGPINRYRNWTLNWERLAGVDETIHVPTLFIGARDDVVVSLNQIEAMTELIPDLELHVLDDCGHWSQQERPDEVNRLMLEWLVKRG